MPWVNAPQYLIVERPTGTKANKRNADNEVFLLFCTSSEDYAQKVFKDNQRLNAAKSGHEFVLFKEVRAVGEVS
jgi:hypothetical protein